MIAIRIAFAAGLMAFAPAAGAPQLPSVEIPSIGCPTGGMETESAPPDTVKPTQLDPGVASRLAFYDEDVLGPRGWRCQRYLTDTGYMTYVTPKSFSDSETIDGPVILSFNLDSTATGRYAIAQILARYVPGKRRDFVRNVMAEDDVSRHAFSFHPFRRDRLIFRNGDLFEVETPPHANGLGTQWLRPGRLAVRSRLDFYNGGEPGFLILQVRMPAQMNALLPAILAQVSR